MDTPANAKPMLIREAFLKIHGSENLSRWNAIWNRIFDRESEILNEAETRIPDNVRKDRTKYEIIARYLLENKEYQKSKHSLRSLKCDYYDSFIGFLNGFNSIMLRGEFIAFGKINLTDPLFTRFVPELFYEYQVRCLADIVMSRLCSPRSCDKIVIVSGRRVISDPDIDNREINLPNYFNLLSLLDGLDQSASYGRQSNSDLPVKYISSVRIVETNDADRFDLETGFLRTEKSRGERHSDFVNANGSLTRAPTREMKCVEDLNRAYPEGVPKGKGFQSLINEKIFRESYSKPVIERALKDNRLKK